MNDIGETKLNAYIAAIPQTLDLISKPLAANIAIMLGEVLAKLFAAQQPR